MYFNTDKNVLKHKEGILGSLIIIEMKYERKTRLSVKSIPTFNKDVDK